MRILTLFIIAIALGIFGCQTKPDNAASSQGGAGSTKTGNAEVTKSEGKAPSTKASKKEDSAKPKEKKEAKAKTGITSIYTDLVGCKTIEKNEEEAWSLEECAGVGGYKLVVAEGDIRQTINVISPSGKKSELNLWSVVSPAFSSVGKKAEWRIKTVEGKPVPFALIVRYNASENAEKPEKTTSYLTVSKIDGDSSCVTDIVKPIKNANVKAREFADVSSSKPCLKR